jgi:glucose/arabinose dehydrogenase/uncharacterized cupredoxin-like copper-binding protein
MNNLKIFFLLISGLVTLSIFAQHNHQHHHTTENINKQSGVQKAEKQFREEDYYKIINMGLPSDVILEAGGVCTLPNGKLAVSTRRGEVWIVSSPYGTNDANKATYNRFARGLHEILGLQFKDGSLYVAQRGELTKLTDSDGDGIADKYESITRLPTVGHYHEYSYGPVFDNEGNMVVSLNVAFGDSDWYNGKSYAPWRGWVIKVTPDGKILPWAAGVRSPCGIGIGPEGKVFYTENQGDWVGSGYMTVVEKGDFISQPASLAWSEKPESPVKARFSQVKGDGRPLYEVKNEITGLRLPSVWLPHGVMGVSTADFVADTVSGKFGPFDGQYFVGDQGQSKIVRVAFEKVNNVWQGAAFGFREGFASGVLRMAWGTDGSMFVGQTNRGWASTGPAPFALQRLLWTGQTPFEMHHISARPDGFEIGFTHAVDSVSAMNPSSYLVSNFIYKYHNIYGSPIIREGKNPLKAIVLSKDRKSVRLVVDSLHQYHIHEIAAEGVLSETGLELLHPQGYYTLNEIPAGEKIDLTKTPKLKFEIPVSVREDKVGVKASGAKVTPGKSGIANFEVPQNLKRVNTMPVTWTRGPDKTITLGTTPGMRYDLATIDAKPGQKIRLIFNNYDDMQHNLVIVKPGTMDKVGLAAAKLGIGGNKVSYAPKDNSVLFHTGILQPSSNESIYFEVPPFEGRYGFVCTMPGHYVIMRGEFVVKK